MLKYEQVLQALTGAQAVISTLGHIKGSDPMMQTKGIENIIRAMQELGMRRLISLTGTGARLQEDTPSLMDTLLNRLVTMIDPDRMRDGVEHSKVIQNSGLDWTVVRVLKLGNSQKNVQNYTLTSGGPVELLTSRKKVAHIMLDVLEDKKYFGAMPVVSA